MFYGATSVCCAVCGRWQTALPCLPWSSRARAQSWCRTNGRMPTSSTPSSRLQWSRCIADPKRANACRPNSCHGVQLDNTWWVCKHCMWRLNVKQLLPCRLQCSRRSRRSSAASRMVTMRSSLHTDRPAAARRSRCRGLQRHRAAPSALCRLHLQPESAKLNHAPHPHELLATAQPEPPF